MPPKVVMNALRANPCSLNLVPPAKKHMPRTYGYKPSQLSPCDRTGRGQNNSLPILWTRRRGPGSASDVPQGWEAKQGLTQVAQDGADEGRLYDTELAFH